MNILDKVSVCCANKTEAKGISEFGSLTFERDVSQVCGGGEASERADA